MARRQRRQAPAEARSAAKPSQDDVSESSSRHTSAGNQTPRNTDEKLAALSELDCTGIEEGLVAPLRVAADAEPAKRGSSEIVCQVLKLNGDLCAELLLTKDSTVSDIKDTIEQRTCIPAERQKLLLDQLELSSDMQVPTIEDSHTLSLCLVILSEPSWVRRPCKFASKASKVLLSTESYDKGVHRVTMRLERRAWPTHSPYLDMIGICEANADAASDPSGGPGSAAWCATTGVNDWKPCCRLQVRQQGRKAKERTVSQVQVSPVTAGSVVEITLDCNKRCVSFRVADLAHSMTELGVVEDLPENAYRFFVTVGQRSQRWGILRCEALNI